MNLDMALHRAVTGRGRVIGLLAFLLFVAIRFSLDPVLEDRSPFLLFAFAVMIGAVYGGFWIGVAIALVGGVTGVYFLASALSAREVLTSGHLLQLSIYLAVCFGIATIVDALQRASRRVEQVAEEQAQLADERARLVRRLREAGRAKDHFLTMVSHELRTPLNAIVGWSGLLASGRLDGGRGKSAIEAIQNNARRQARLLGDLLDSSRMAVGKLRLQTRVIEPHEIVEQALAGLQPAADAKSIRLSFDGRRAGSLRADPDRLLQVVSNLLANAVKFTPEGGHVAVELSATESHVRLVVEDSGPGIPSEFLPHVFEKFSQARPGGGGLGLGLAVSRDLVEMHGGVISVENAGVGGGARFEVTLPRSALGPVLPFRHDPSFEEFRDLRRAVLQDVRVMIVDDEPDACRALADLIESFGADVIAADSAAAAVRAAAEKRPDVLLADINLPGDDGWTLLGQIRDLAPEWESIPAAALSGRTSPADKRRSYDAGFRRHMTKPAEPAEVIAVLATLAALTKDEAHRTAPARRRAL